MENSTDETIKFMKKKKKTFNIRSKQETTESLAEEQDEHQNSNSNQDSTPTIDEVIALRKLKQNKVGIDLNKLNAGEPKKKKKKRNPTNPSEILDDGPTRILKPVDGEEDDLKKDGRLGEDDPEDEDARTRKIIKSNHFTQQTNTLDVDKHMMAYIEEELQRRRKEAIAAGTAEESTEPILKGMDAIASLDPRDELYMIAEKYRITKKPVVEGNVTLSATMLTSIPEVDLGIDNRIRNFEATEKAKRLLTEQRSHNHPNNMNTSIGQSSSANNKNRIGETRTENGINTSTTTATNYMIDTKEHFAADRFLLPNHLKQQHSINNNMVELDSLKIAKLEKEGLLDQAEALRKDLKRKAYQLKYGNNNNNNNQSNNHRFHGHRSNQLATDDRAVENFRKRMAGRR